MKLKKITIAALTVLAAGLISATSSISQPSVTVAQAAVNTGGYSTATGSSEASVTVTNLKELQNAFYEGRNHIIISGHIYGGSKPVFLTFADTSWNNTTIEGINNAQLENIQLKFSGELLSNGTNIENIVIKNITFYGRISDLQALSGEDTQPGGVGTNYEGISFRRITNGWIEHCTIYNTSDDLMSITRESDNITVSYNHFYFTDTWINMDPNPMWNWVGTNQDLASERLAMVIGANPNDSHINGGSKLHVTMHHNWFGPYMKGRPLMRGYVHMYNNYFGNNPAPSGTNSKGTSQQQYNASQIGSGGVVYSEGNYFYKTNNSHQIGLNSSSDPFHFYLQSTDTNIYDQTTGTNQAASHEIWPSNTTFPYSYTLDVTSNVPNIVQAQAGPQS